MSFDIHDDVPFEVWRKTRSVAEKHAICALSPKLAAEKHARADWIAGEASWPITYCVRDGVNGTLWAIDVAIATQPTFVAIDAREIEMPAGTHVLWGGRVLCEDLRLRGVPRDWPEGQRWISIKDVADGAESPLDHCETCWTKMSSIVEGLQQIGR